MTRSGKRRFCYVTFLSSTYYLQKDLIFLMIIFCIKHTVIFIIVFYKRFYFVMAFASLDVYI